MRTFDSTLSLSFSCALLVFLVRSTSSTADAFSLTSPPTTFATRRTINHQLASAATTNTEPTLTESEEKVCGFLRDLYDSKLQFRIVVVGNGAILESSHTLGPTMSLSQSPKSGANLVTFASEDKSFELHLQASAVSKVALVEKEIPAGPRTMRILRLTNDQGQSICSLIVSEDSETTAEWFRTMITKYGEEWQV